MWEWKAEEMIHKHCQLYGFWSFCTSWFQCLSELFTKQHKKKKKFCINPSTYAPFQHLHPYGFFHLKKT